MAISLRRGVLGRLITLVVAGVVLHAIYVATTSNNAPLEECYPWATSIIQDSTGHGGAWYIPSTWPLNHAELSTNITQAARAVSRLVQSSSDFNLQLSHIPRIVHQSWKSRLLDGFPDKALPAIETWLDFVNDGQYPETAYFFWDDEGVSDFVHEFQPDIVAEFDMLPHPVVKSDLFRILVCNLMGGVYADIDTTPLRHPFSWVSQSDVTPWVDEVTNATYGQHEGSSSPVSLILGIEADTPEDSDSYWRMGYTYPVQLTQWALASAQNHPVLNRFLQDFRQRVRDSIHTSPRTDPLMTKQEDSDLYSADPLELSGPVAITQAAMAHLTSVAKLRWQALSGLLDGGRSKLVEDVLILPITGFSPGRGRYGNMGSHSYSHADARLRHDAQGSWRHWALRVEFGKACRSLLGRCRYWSKVP